MSKPMYRDDNRIQGLLERGFQECLERVLTLQGEIEEELEKRAAFQLLSNDEIVGYVSDLCSAVYQIIANTLFRLIPMFHPRECNKHERINFYFWPGYHSYLGTKRIFVRKKIKGRSWNLGVGICGVPDADADELDCYDDCSQARWYHYLIRPRNKSDIRPGDLHTWLLNQRPQSEQHESARSTHVYEVEDLISSLTVATKPTRGARRNEFRNHRFLSLGNDPQRSDGWGRRLSKEVNKMRKGQNKEWIFPDKGPGASEQEIRWRNARSKMQSVWLHAAFSDHHPTWLDGFIEKLNGDKETAPAGEALGSGLDDEVATDWGDASRNRPHFRNWTNLSLDRWPVPGLPPDYDLLSRAVGWPLRTLASQTVGSAAFLSSIPFRPNFLAEVRRWVTTLYGMIRSAEISVHFHNYRVEVDTANMLTGAYWANELKKLIDEGLSTVWAEAGDEGSDAVNTRRFVLYSVRSLSSLAYDVTNGFLSRRDGAMDTVKRDFLAPLRRLHEDKKLEVTLQGVAEQFYNSIRQENRGQLVFPQPSRCDLPFDPESVAQHGSCFLLVAEMIRTYCKHGRSGCVAKWNARLENDILTIRLKGPTRAQSSPTLLEFTRLDVFLRTLKIGEASVALDNEKTCTYAVRVDLSDEANPFNREIQKPEL